jgi:hypothetical protein
MEASGKACIDAAPGARGRRLDNGVGALEGRVDNLIQVCV